MCGKADWSRIVSTTNLLPFTGLYINDVLESRAMWQKYKFLSLFVFGGVMLLALGMLEVRVHWITHAELI